MRDVSCRTAIRALAGWCFVFLLCCAQGGEPTAVERTVVDQTSVDDPAWELQKTRFLRSFSCVLAEHARTHLPGCVIEVKPNIVQLSWRMRNHQTNAHPDSTLAFGQVFGPDSVRLSFKLSGKEAFPTTQPPIEQSSEVRRSIMNLLWPCPIPGLKEVYLTAVRMQGVQADLTAFRQIPDMQALVSETNLRIAEQSTSSPKTHDVLALQLFDNLQRIACEELKLKGVCIQLERNSIELAYDLKDSVIYRPTSMVTAEKREDREYAPIPAGLLLEVQIADAGASAHQQAVRPQILTYPARLLAQTPTQHEVTPAESLYTSLLAEFPYEPLKAEIIANLSYGTQTDKRLIEIFSSPARWLGGPVGTDGK